MSAEHDPEEFRTLFDDVPLADPTATRDLIGPAVAWGRTRRRIDRLALVGATGALTVAAVVGAVALRPGGGGADGTNAAAGGPTTHGQPVQTPGKALPFPKPATVDQFFQDFDALLPPGYHAANGMRMKNLDPIMTITAPDGSTNAVQMGPGADFLVEGPVDSGSFHLHTASVAIPLVSGQVSVPGGMVAVQSRDVEVQYFWPDPPVAYEGSPHQAVGLEAQYSFKGFHIQLMSLVKPFPWKGGKSAADISSWGYSPAGPVLTPEQFAKIAADPAFGTLVNAMSKLEMPPPVTTATTPTR